MREKLDGQQPWPDRQPHVRRWGADGPKPLQRVVAGEGDLGVRGDSAHSAHSGHHECDECDEYDEYDELFGADSGERRRVYHGVVLPLDRSAGGDRESGV